MLLASRFLTHRGFVQLVSYHLTVKCPRNVLPELYVLKGFVYSDLRTEIFINLLSVMTGGGLS